MFTFAEKLKQMSNIEHKDVGVSSLKGTPSKKIYIKTSTEAVYNPEGVTQEYINNHVDGSKIVDGTITTGKIADNAVTMGKLDNEVQTLIQQGADSSWTPKGDFNIETTYDANDVVFDPVTNSSYLSLRADNTGHSVDENDEEYEEGWWMKVLDGSYVNRAIEEMETAIAQAIEDAQEDIDDAIAGANTAAQNANEKVAWMEEQVDSLTAYEVATALDETSIIPVQNKVVTENIRLYNEISLSQYTIKNCGLADARWYYTTTGGGYGKHIAIPVVEGEKYYMWNETENRDDGSFYGWLTSAYTGTTPYNGLAIPYVTGTSRQRLKEGVVTAPTGAAYLILHTRDNAGNNVTNILKKVVRIKDLIADDAPTRNSGNLVYSRGIYNALLDKVNVYDVLETFNLSDYEEKDCCVGNGTTWYMSGEKGRHKCIRVQEGKYYRLSSLFLVAWLTDYNGHPTNGESVNLAAGTRRFFCNANTIIQAPTNAQFLCIITVDGAGTRYDNQTSKVEELNVTTGVIDNIESFVGTVKDSYIIVDLTQYTPVAGIIRGDATAWYVAAGFTHIAVPVTPNTKYVVKTGRWGNYALLQSYSGTESAPVFCSGFSQRADIFSGTYVITTPSDAAYIVFSASSNGSNTLPDFMATVKILPWVINKMMSEGQTKGTYQQKIRYAHWNIGHFSYYDRTIGAGDTTITEEMSPVMQKRYKEMINKVSPDIFGICEYNPEFDLGGSLTKDVILQNYKYQVIGTKRGYPCNSVFGNVMLTPVSEVLYTHHKQNTYYKAVKAIISGIEVYIVETHLDWQNAEAEGQPTTNTLQQQQLIAAFANYDHVILSGDFNVNYIEQYQLFVDAGYTLVSGSYLNLDTYLKYLTEDPPRSDYLDNIMVKGFAVSNVKAWDESGYYENGLSDHSIISCDLLLLP